MDTDKSNAKCGDDVRMIPLTVIVDACMKLTNMNVAKEIMLVLYRSLNKVGARDKDYEMVDRIEEGVIKNMMQLAGGNTFINPNVTMKETQVESIYRITGNDNVNLGGMTNG